MAQCSSVAPINQTWRQSCSHSLTRPVSAKAARTKHQLISEAKTHPEPQNRSSIPTPLTTLLLHKPYGYLSQFTPEPTSRWKCLKELVAMGSVYAAGRLDADSEGLLLLTSNGRLQQRLTDPRFGHWRHYWVQVEGSPQPQQLQRLREGLILKGQRTLPAKVNHLGTNQTATIPERDPPIRFRQAIPTHWLEIGLREGRNRQIRKMTAAVGLPTLRLIRHQIDLMDNGPPLSLNNLAPGNWRELNEEEARRVNSLLHPPGN